MLISLLLIESLVSQFTATGAKGLHPCLLPFFDEISIYLAADQPGTYIKCPLSASSVTEVH